ncbi:hypothetical protein FO519_002402 [Halicephalobus sp. NKZ332]|nr:hypothetical protein FO519_002402 [Halicephalobus sp. NKZ332]
MGDAIAQRSFRKRKYVNSERVIMVEKALDLTLFIKQLGSLIAQPIKIPSNHQQFPSANKHNAQDFFSVDGIWPDEATHRAEVSKLFNCSEVEGDRKQLLSLMIDDSDTDSGSEQPMTVKNLHQMLKVHRKRRRYQTKCHEDPLNTQYKFYGAGLLSSHDRFPAYQREVRKAFSYDFIEKTETPANTDSFEEFEAFQEPETDEFSETYGLEDTENGDSELSQYFYDEERSTENPE